MTSQKDISEYLVLNGAQLVPHAALLEPGQTIAVLPDTKQKSAYILQTSMFPSRNGERKRNYQTRNILFTIVQVPPTAEFVQQNDSSGILFIEDLVSAHEITRKKGVFVKHDAEEPPTTIGERMIKDGRVYFIPKETRIYKSLKNI